MILADTSIWIDHFRRGNSNLSILLQDGQVFIHPFILGELACGNFKDRQRTLSLLSELPQAKVAEHEEVMELVKNRKLFGKGIAWIDAHLLASTCISGLRLWTSDKALSSAASSMKVYFGGGRA